MKLIKRYKQFIIFGIVGLSNTVLSYIIYIATLRICEKYHLFSDYDYLVGSVVGFIISVLWSFYWNNKVTFKNNDKKPRSIWRALLKTYISYAFSGLVLSNVLLVVFVEWLNVQKEIAPLLALTITVPLNYILNKYWVFQSDTRDHQSNIPNHL